MSISDVILFYSGNSEKCKSCVDLIRRGGLPIRQVRLDSSTTRDIVQNGNLFKIEYVPTLAVIITDGTASLFEGSTKVMAKVNELIRSMQVENSHPSQIQEQQPRQQPQPQIPPQQPQIPPQQPQIPPQQQYIQPPSQIQEHPPPQPYRQPSNPPQNIQYQTQLPELGGEPLYGPEPTKKHRKSKKHKSRGHKKREKNYNQIENIQPPVEEYFSEEEYGETNLEFVDNPPDHSVPNPNRREMQELQAKFGGSQYQPKKGAGGGDIMNVAKQMEAARTQTLGYSEKDLPGGF
ncbi:hypothetical protein OAG24_00530 [bacterium]|nr:hypothetical protein [bacterium]